MIKRITSETNIKINFQKPYRMTVKNIQQFLKLLTTNKKPFEIPSQCFRNSTDLQNKILNDTHKSYSHQNKTRHPIIIRINQITFRSKTSNHCLSQLPIWPLQESSFRNSSDFLCESLFRREENISAFPHPTHNDKTSQIKVKTIKTSLAQGLFFPSPPRATIVANFPLG